MKTTTIERTSDTPSITLDAERNWVEIIGNSYPENALEFYQPVYDWVKGSFSEGVTSLTVMLKLNYFNTSSAKCILNLFSILQEYHHNGKKIEVQWFYDEEDEDMLETGKAFSVDFNMPFSIRSYTV